jgi:hypothetical protein
MIQQGGVIFEDQLADAFVQKLQAIKFGQVVPSSGRTRLKTFPVVFGAIALEDQQRFKREVMRRIVCL